MKRKVGVLITLVSILLVGIVAFNGCKKSTPTKPAKPAKPATQTKAVEPNQPKK
jgi:hypothetical protein